MKNNFEEPRDATGLNPEDKFLFLAMMEAVVASKEMGKKKAEFVAFAEEVWCFAEKNGGLSIKDVLVDFMREDIELLLKKKNEETN